MANEEARKRHAFSKLTRLMISGHDLQQALSAATFLLEEVDETANYPLAEMRRLRCYETAMVIAYAAVLDGKGRGQAPDMEGHRAFEERGREVASRKANQASKHDLRSFRRTVCGNAGHGHASVFRSQRCGFQLGDASFRRRHAVFLGRGQ